MKPRFFLLTILTIIIAIGLIDSNGIIAAFSNNVWTVGFIRHYRRNPNISPAEFLPPTSHQHAGMLLAHQALKQDNVDLAWTYLEPQVATPDMLILQSQASINFLQEDYISAINIWKDLGRYSTLYTAARNLSDEENLDAKILAYRSAYEIRGGPYDRLFTSSSMKKAELLIEAGQINQAIDIYRALINEFPGDARPYSGLAHAHWTNNQPDQALSVIKQGWDVNTGNTRFYITAAQYYEELGMVEEGLNAYQTVLLINPDHRDALQGVERLSISE